MKIKILLLASLALACLISQAAQAADITVPNTFSAGTPAKAEEVNQNFNTVYDAVNGINAKLTDNITNNNISPTAQIDQSKIQGSPFAGQTHSHNAPANIVTKVRTTTRGWLSQYNTVQEVDSSFRATISKKSSDTSLHINLKENLGVQSGSSVCKHSGSHGRGTDC